jgi:hypothetical protein
MTRAFARQLGVTPSRYRAAVLIPGGHLQFRSRHHESKVRSIAVQAFSPGADDLAKTARELIKMPNTEAGDP